jgi:hypothetical protein
MTVTIKATILYDGQFYVGTFERIDREGYAIARHVFGKEPADPEIYAFVQDHYSSLQFGSPEEFTLKIKRMNPKRVQREVCKEMEQLKKTARPSTHAQNYIQKELEKKKKQRKRTTKAEKLAREEELFSKRQEKKKRKHKGR